jgi:hypothetical protein
VFGETAPAGAVAGERSPQETAAVKTEPLPQPPAQPEDIPKKPVAELPARKQPAASQPRVAGALQPVMVITSPSGATATLDGRPDQACTTPCSLDAAAGHHAVAFTLPGYQIEHRDITVGSGPMEEPAVILHAFSGVLMLSSTPPGASILVNGKPVTETTPAQLSLPPGTYKIAVQKNGLQSVSTVEIRNGDTRVLRVTLGQ